MAYYTVRYSYTTVRTRLEFSETDLRTVSGYDHFAVNSSQVEFLLTVRTNILVKHHPGYLHHDHLRLFGCTFKPESDIRLSYKHFYFASCPVTV